jgi:hypothetical protein
MRHKVTYAGFRQALVGYIEQCDEAITRCTADMANPRLQLNERTAAEDWRALFTNWRDEARWCVTAMDETRDVVFARFLASVKNEPGRTMRRWLRAYRHTGTLDLSS